MSIQCKAYHDINSIFTLNTQFSLTNFYPVISSTQLYILFPHTQALHMMVGASAAHHTQRHIEHLVVMKLTQRFARLAWNVHSKIYELVAVCGAVASLLKS